MLYVSVNQKTNLFIIKLLVIYITITKRLYICIYKIILGLRFDIANAPIHRIFDIHEKCSAYFCKKSGVPQKNSLEEISKLKTVRQEINTNVSRLSNNVESLIMDVDNNACEQFNSF